MGFFETFIGAYGWAWLTIGCVLGLCGLLVIVVVSD